MRRADRGTDPPAWLRSADGAETGRDVALLTAVEALLVAGLALRVAMGTPAVPDVQSAPPPAAASLFLTRLCCSAMTQCGIGAVDGVAERRERIRSTQM